MSLISKEYLKYLISAKLPSLQDLKVASAYVTDNGVDWLNAHLSEAAQVHLVVRGRPHDFLSGASTISALSKGLQFGWNVHINQDLHAKIYIIDNDDCFVGSSNLTANGLILSAQGNIEANLHFKANVESLQFFDNILRNSKKIDAFSIRNMQSFLEEYSSIERNDGIIDSFWDPKILKEEANEIFTIDFPLKGIGDNQYIGNRFSDIDRKFLSNQYLEARQLFKQTRIYHWTLRQLHSNGPLHYGRLTKLIHDSLCDDPTPYRKDVKKLLSNLLMYFDKLSDEIRVSRPNHSQLIDLYK